MKARLITRLRTAPLVVALCCFSAVWVVNVWYSVGQQVDAARTRARHDAIAEASNFARLVEEHTVRTIGAADQALQFVRHEFLEKGDKLDLGQLLADGVIPGDIANLYSIIAPDGEVVLASKPWKAVNVADRDHVRVHLESSQPGLVISKPVLGRITGQWSLQLTRRIDLHDGRFAGVASVSIDPFYFSRLYQSAQLSPNSVVTLVGADGVVRARRSTDPSTIGQDLSGSEQFRQIGSQRSGLVTARSHIDGRLRTSAFRRLKDYPLLVIVGIDLADIEQSLVSLRSQQVKQAIISTVGILLFTAVLLLLTRRLLLSRAKAVNANAAKNQFLSNMSHELRTPLNGILGYAELLKMEAGEEEHREYAGVIQASGLQLLSLVDQLLQLNRIEAQSEGPALAAEDIRKLVDEVIQAHQDAARSKALALRVWVNEHVPPTVECDRAKLVQVLHYLLDNAIRFTEAGSVELVLTPGEGTLVFLVTDTGPGIPAALQAKVFDKFYQIDSSDSRRSDGAGLGLSLVRELVAAMGGETGLKSSPGTGATFYFNIPCPRDDAGAVKPVPTEEMACAHPPS